MNKHSTEIEKILNELKSKNVGEFIYSRVINHSDYLKVNNEYKEINDYFKDCTRETYRKVVINIYKSGVDKINVKFCRYPSTIRFCIEQGKELSKESISKMVDNVILPPYILSFIDFMRTNNGVAYKAFTP